MGHKKKNAKPRSLHQQAYDRLKSMLHLGDSKAADKKKDREQDTDIVFGKIYSVETYQAYKKACNRFLKWVNANHPGTTTLDDAKKYVSEWLQLRVDAGLSAWTIQLDECALNKLYGIRKEDPQRFQPPKRRKEDIKRSRGTKVRDGHFSELKNEELVNYLTSTGCRRNVAENVTGDDLYDRARIEETLKKALEEGDKGMVKACKDALNIFPDDDYFLLHRKDKGGKTRLSPIVGPYKERVIERMKNTPPGQRVWQYVNSNCDVHSYRSDYATYLYRAHARRIEDLRFETKIKCADGKYRSVIYVCRGDEAGKRLDREALGIVSIALGHNREDTAISNYIRNL